MTVPDPAAQRRGWLESELRRMYGRPQTLVIAAVLAIVPAALAAAVAHGGPMERVTAQLAAALAGRSGPDFAVFCLTASGKFVAIVLAAHLFGDTLARERAWGTLQLRLSAPVPRTRVLLQKTLAATLVLALLVGWFVAAAFAAGVIAFGTGGADLAPLSARLALAAGYLVLNALWVGAAALAWAAVSGGGSTAPTAAAIALALLSNVFGALPFDGLVREALPTRHADAWRTWFGSALPELDVAVGSAIAALYATLLLTVAVVAFRLRDLRD